MHAAAVLASRSTSRPPGFNVRTTVHEYGGGAYLVASGHGRSSPTSPTSGSTGRSSAADPSPITPETGRPRSVRGRRVDAGRPVADLRPRAARRRRPAGVVERAGRDPVRRLARSRATIALGPGLLLDAADLPDGSRLCWLEWDHPWMPWDGTELWVADLERRRPLRTSGRSPAGRRGVDLPARVEPGGRAALRLRPDRLVEPVPGARRRRCEPLHPAEARVRLAPMAVRRVHVRVPRRTGGSRASAERDGVQHVALLDSGVGRAASTSDVPHTAIAGRRSRRRRSRRLRRRRPVDPRSGRLARLTARSIDVLRSSASVDDRRRVSLGPAPDRVPDRGRLTAYALLLPAARTPTSAGAGRRAAAADRDEPRRPDLARPRRRSRPRHPVLDEPRVRGRRRQLRRQHRLRPRVPASGSNGNWGIVDTDGLHRRGALPRGAGRGRRRAAADPRRQRRRLHDALRARRSTTTFAAGASYFGVADLEAFGTGETHKFESRYLDTPGRPLPGGGATCTGRARRSTSSTRSPAR